MREQDPMSPSVASVPTSAKRGWLPRAAHPVSWGMLVITTLAILVVSVDAQLLPTILPAVLTQFKLTPAEGGWLNSLFFLGSVFGAVFFGIWSDIVGSGYRRGMTWVIAYLVAVVGGFLTWLLGRSYLLFELLRLVMGFSRGGSEPTNVALISDWWQRENRGFAVGAHHTGFPFGQFVGPALMALVLTYGSWPDVYLLIPLIGVPIIIAQLLVGTRRNQERVFSWIASRGLTKPFEEIVGAKPFRNPATVVSAAFSHRNTWLCITIIFFYLWAEIGVVSFMTLQLTREVHLSLGVAAVVSGASGLTGWVGQVVWGTISDRIGRRPVLAVLALGWSVSTLMLLKISSETTGWLLLLFWGLFRNAPYPVAYTMLIDSIGEASGAGMGLMIGIAFGICGLIVGPVAGFFIQTWGWTADYVMFASATLLTLIPLGFTRETVIPTLVWPARASISRARGRAPV